VKAKIKVIAIKFNYGALEAEISPKGMGSNNEYI
jgi:hypothetical protein